MIYTLDFEFHEEPRTVLPISVGLVAEDGREYYAEWLDTIIRITEGQIKVNDFVIKHVMPQVTQPPDYGTGSYLSWYYGERFATPLRTEEEIRKELLAFLNPNWYGKPEIWGYFADYDWVLFCQTFGRMVDLPGGYPHFCRDIKQEMEARHLTKDAFPVDSEKEHHALGDARWNMRTLINMRGALYERNGK